MHDLSDLIVYRNEQKTRTGTLYEQDIFGYLKSVAVHPAEAQWCIDTDTDTKEGTDFIIDGTRIDATTDFKNKDNMPFIFETNIPATRYENFKIGVRIANTHDGYTEFPEPVIVIGMDIDSHDYKIWRNVIIENIEKHAPKLIQAIQAAYDDYVLTDQDDRQYLDQPLRPNPEYKHHPNLSDRYNDLNQFQQQIMADKEEYEFGTY